MNLKEAFTGFPHIPSIREAGESVLKKIAADNGGVVPRPGDEYFVTHNSLQKASLAQAILAHARLKAEADKAL